MSVTVYPNKNNEKFEIDFLTSNLFPFKADSLFPTKRTLNERLLDADGTATKCPFLKMSKWDVSISYSSNTVSTYCYYNKLTSMKQLRNHTLFLLHIGESGFPNPRNFC